MSETLYGAAAVEVGSLAFGVEVAIMIWGYDLRGPGILEVAARVAEEGGNADLNGPPLWDHPEWLEGWVRNGVQWTPPLHHALPYVPGSPWSQTRESA